MCLELSVGSISVRKRSHLGADVEHGSDRLLERDPDDERGCTTDDVILNVVFVPNIVLPLDACLHDARANHRDSSTSNAGQVVYRRSKVADATRDALRLGHANRFLIHTVDCSSRIRDVMFEADNVAPDSKADISKHGWRWSCFDACGQSAIGSAI